MWDKLLATEDVVSSLAGNILTKSVWLQAEYMGSNKKKKKLTIYGVSFYNTEEQLRFFVDKVADLTSVKSKTGITTGDFKIIVSLTRKNFMDIPNVLTFGGRPIFSKSCLGKRPASQPHPSASTGMIEAETITK